MKNIIAIIVATIAFSELTWAAGNCRIAIRSVLFSNFADYTGRTSTTRRVEIEPFKKVLTAQGFEAIFSDSKVQARLQLVPQLKCKTSAFGAPNVQCEAIVEMLNSKGEIVYQNSSPYSGISNAIVGFHVPYSFEPIIMDIKASEFKECSSLNK